MGLLDKLKNLAGKTDDAADLAKEHADKLPGDMGDMGDKVAETVDKMTDKIPGNED